MAQSEHLLSGTKLWLSLFRAYRSVEKIDLESVKALGFACITDFALLEILLHLGPLPVSTIGKKVLLTSGSVTSAIDRAEKAGLVERSRDTKDRRTVIVALTTKGQQRIQIAFTEHAKNLDLAFTKLSAEERKQLVLLLAKVRNQD
ncbi:MarR family transcriptional regulator [Rubellicoccus peritrichatus]|uniref:MarR family transcriptional regulator n=1 Tax=Rubellicoccus peritrichatus TaxID=3080537 RepID=A0AAQ3QTR9_9BACT|nr:MarR family transcriptional regulator [Puniceicoccus sp. CR14]WOO39285.1 MarR family transcriptional regulator [Puniceicoccus sp. CR14]